MNESANSFDRFRYFWWTLAIFAVFGLAAGIFALSSKLAGGPSDINSYDDERRIKVRKEVDVEQAQLFSDFLPSDAFSAVGAELLASKARVAPVQPAAPPSDPAPAEAPMTEAPSQGEIPASN